MKKRLSEQIWRRIAAATTGPISLTILTAYGGKPGKQAKGQEKAEDINIVLDWYPDAVYAFLCEAVGKGYFAEEGLNIHVQFPSDGGSATLFVSAGEAEFGLYYQRGIIQMVTDQSAEVKLLDAVCQNSLGIMLSLKDKSILSSKDLESKTVGYAGTPLSKAMVPVLVRKVGADTNVLTLKNIGFNLMSSMTTGQMDAIMGCLVNHEVPRLGEEDFSLNYSSPIEYGIPNYYELYLVMNDSVLRDKPELVEKFVHAARKGLADFKAGPDVVVKLLLEKQNAKSFPLNENVEKKSTTVLLPKMESDSASFLSQTGSYWQENIDWMKQEGLTQRAPEFKELLPAGNGN